MTRKTRRKRDLRQRAKDTKKKKLVTVVLRTDLQIKAGLRLKS